MPWLYEIVLEGALLISFPLRIEKWEHVEQPSEEMIKQVINELTYELGWHIFMKYSIYREENARQLRKSHTRNKGELSKGGVSVRTSEDNL